MPTPRSRRALLRGVGVVALAGSAGCLVNTANERTTTDDTSRRTYSFEVTNMIDRSTLRKADGVDEDAPAVITLDVAHPVQAGDDEVIFEQTVEVPPESSTTVEDAFTTEPGKSYAIGAKLEQFKERSRRRARRFRAGTRFEVGGAGVPEDTTFTVTVQNDPPPMPDEDEQFLPVISLY